ncbi:MAG: hypothetical protein RR272_04120 [Synergistaceae bacterium]
MLKTITYKKTLILAIFFLSLFIFVSEIDFLGTMVINELNKVVSEKLNISVSVKEMDGNPFVGFDAKNLTILRDGKKLITTENTSINLSLISLIKGSPRVSLIKIHKCDTDVDTLKSIMPKKQTSTSKEIPIDKIILSDVSIDTPYGIFKTKKSVIVQKDTQAFELNVKATLKDKKVSLGGKISENNGVWDVDNLKIGMENSTIVTDGTVYPTPDLKVKVKELDHYLLNSLFSQINTYGVKGILSSTTTVKGFGREMELKGEGTLSNAVINKIPLSNLKTSWSYDKGIVSLTVDNAKIFGSTLEGNFYLDTTKQMPETELKLNVRNLDFTDWKNKISIEEARDLSGKISVISAEIKGPLNALLGNAEISPSNLTYKNFEVKDLKGKISFDGTPLGTVNISATHKNQPMTITGKLAFAQNYKTDLKISNLSFSLTDLKEIIPAIKENEIQSNVKIDGTIKTIENHTGITLTATTPQLTAKKIGKIQNLKTEILYTTKNKDITIQNTSAIYNNAKINVSGSINTKGTKNINITGTSTGLDIETLYELVPFFKTVDMKTKVNGKYNITGDIKNIKFAAQLQTPKIKFLKMNFNNAKADILYSTTDKILKVSPISAYAHNGQISFSSIVDLSTLGQENGKKYITWEANGNVNSVELEILDELFEKKQDIKGKANLNLKIQDKGDGITWETDSNDSSLSWQQFALSDIKGKASGTKSKIDFYDTKIVFLHGKNTISGSVILPKSGEKLTKTQLNLNVTSEELNLYEALRKYIPKIRGFQGLAQGKVTIKGSLKKPLYNGVYNFTPLRYRSFNLPQMNVEFNGSFTEFNITNAKAKIEGYGDIRGTSKMYKDTKDNQWKTKTIFKGDGVGLKQFGEYLPESIRKGLGGKANFSLNIHGKLSEIKGEGKFSSPRFRFLGVRFTDTNAQFYISSGYLIMEDLKSNLNGGTVNGGVAFDIKENKWGTNVTAMDVNVEETIKQLAPNLKGKVTGKANFKARFSGETARLSTVRGGGALFLNKGEISEFPAVEAAKKYTAGKPIRFETIQTTFTYDGGDITILPGSKAIAPDMDPVYRFVMLDGLITHKKELSLFLLGKVNIRALNTLLGAMNGIVSLGSTFVGGTIDKTQAIKDVLGGIIGGFAKGDFSYVSMNIHGNTTKPVFSNIKIDKTTKKRNSSSNYIPKSDSDPDEKDLLKGEKTFKLNFEIPLGPGAKKSPSGFSGDFIEQTLENLINNLNIGDQSNEH